MAALAQLVGPLAPGVDYFYDRRRLQNTSPKNRRKQPRTKAEIDKERQERWTKTCVELDEIHLEYLGKLTRVANQATGVAYARFSTRFQDSIADQIRTILEHALELKIYIPRELIFFDMAVRGFKKQREGLDQVERALRAKKASVLLLFSTSRLFRKQYRTLEFVDRMHRGLDVRCIFVKSGVDTDDKQRWQSILAVQSMIDQFVVSMYAANIQAAHEGLLKKQFVFGTLSFGFLGVPIDGEYTQLGRPRCKIAVDPETSQIVLQIYNWYVIDQLSIEAIVCRLNADPSIPLPPRASSGTWTRLAVINVLRNTRYRGLWRYGVTEAVYVPDGDYVKQKMRVEPLSEIYLAELQFVSDDLWYAAQSRLAKRANHGGRPPKNGDRKSRPKLLNGLLLCPEHKQRLYVSGPHGQAMHCPVCARFPAEQRALYSRLNRVLATELICKKLAELVLADPDLPRAVFAVCEREARAAHQPDLGRLSQLNVRLKQINRSIEFTRGSVGETAEDEADAKRAIVEYQRERARLQAEIDETRNAEKRAPRMPTVTEVEDMIKNLAGILTAAAESENVTEVARARQTIELLTGGAIELHQMGERKAKRGWLQARFRVALVPYLVQLATGQMLTDLGDSIEVVVDIVQPPRAAAELERVRELYNEGMLATEIANLLGCSKAKMTKLLKDMAEKYGEPYVDGRTRRATLEKKHTQPPLYQTIAAEVMQLVDSQMYLDEIANQLRVDRNTITQAIRWWHEDRGLTVPDGRSRRRSLPRKQRKRTGGDSNQSFD